MEGVLVEGKGELLEGAGGGGFFNNVVDVQGVILI